MKKLLYLLLVLLCATGLIGCSKSKKNVDVNSDNSKVVTNETEEDSKDATVSPAPTSEVTPTEVTPTEAIAQTTGEVVEVKIDSKALAKNVIKDNATRSIYVYLPPSYNNSKKNYPVVYFLHGYGDSTLSFMQAYQPNLDKAFQNGAQEFILVALDGNNKTGGSFYVNSPVTGNWEDFVVDEVVSYIDTNYRTIAKSDSRGLSGYSMGGFGALYLSLRHPDVYNSTLVFCPGVFAEEDLDDLLVSWNGWTDVSRSYAQAFSPDVKNTTDYGNILKDSDVEAQNKVWSDWMSGYSNWGQKIDDYLALNKPLKSIMITYSNGDSFSWIPTGCTYLMKLMDDKKINYSSDVFDGGHIVPPNAVDKFFIPFFGKNLTY
jgi:enterochelin esterase-like enzyme